MRKIPSRLRLPLLAVLALSLSAFRCSADEVKSTPAAARFERVPLPSAPIGAARCDDDGDGKAEPCLSQAQGDDLFNAVIDVACAANDKLAWLSDYFLGTKLAPSCPPAAPADRPLSAKR